MRLGQLVLYKRLFYFWAVILTCNFSLAVQVEQLKPDKECTEQDKSACQKATEAQPKLKRTDAIWKTSLQGRINCNKDDAESCFKLGLHEAERGNLTASKKFYEKACQLKHGDACNNRAYQASQENQKDLSKKYYKKACDLGVMLSCNVMAYYEIIKDDLYEAYKLYTKACDAKFYLACYGMGWVQAQWQNFILADQYYQMACKEKIKEACENIEAIAERVQKSLKKNSASEKTPMNDIPCERAVKANFLPLVKTQDFNPYGNAAKATRSAGYAVNSAITQVNYGIFNRKKECGIKNLKLPLSHRLPYTGLEVKD
jgi:tetratricopeptide (TPR) repeat protein